VIRADHQAEDLGRLLDVARERGQEIVVRIEPSGSVKVAGKPPSRARTLEESALGAWDHIVDTLVAGLDHGIAGVARLPGVLDALAVKWRENPTASDEATRIATALVGGLLAGLAAWWLARALVRRPTVPPARFIDAFGAGLRVLLVDVVGVGVFVVVAGRLVTWLLPPTGFAQFMARDLVRVAVSTAAYLIVARFLLAPAQPERRLLPIRRPAWHFRLVLIYAAAVAVVFVVSVPVTVLGDTVALAGWILVSQTTIVGFKLWWFWTARHDFAALTYGAAMPPPLGRRIVGAAMAWILIAAALLNWWVGRLTAVLDDAISWGVAAGFTQAAVVLIPICAAGVDRLMADLLGTATAEATPLRQATTAVGRTLATGAVWLVGVLALADVWHVYTMTMGSPMGRAMLTAATTVGVALLTGWVIWRFAAAYLAAHAPKPIATMPGDGDDDAEPSAQSRLATALPLVRVMIMGLVFGLTTLIVLSTLGLDIGPLLAGFGVVGLAISFGSQALVRDIVSGIFFMADDAFRIGEYIDTGRLKGTVEKITLRSVQLRHQSGLVHTIPFGQLQAVTNASRDWATVKFNIRLERGADLERTRKSIKKVGQAMHADPELGGEVIQPLKLQGVADITDTAIVCRLKFTAKPARASWIQREALKRVYAALETDGIPFASGAVTVKSGDPERPANPLAAASVTRLSTEVAG
jgi:small-conductance mechanosensitive channel